MAQLTPSLMPRSRTFYGIATLIVGMVFFAGQDAMMKSLLQSYPIWMLMLVRSVVSICLLCSLILALGAPHRLFSPLWRLHLLRGALFAIAFSFFYAAFPFMPLAQVTTIFFSAPLMIALLAVVFLGERIGLHRAGALIAGFAGVVIAVDPGSAGFSWVAVLPLMCAACYAVSQILARRIGEEESSLTVGLYSMAVAGPVVLAAGYGLNQFVSLGGEFAHLAWAFPATALSDASRLLLLGVLGMFGYVLLSRAYQVADASVIAQFDYSYLPIAATLGWLLWGEVPPASTLVGMALIIGSGLYIGWRELRAARRKGEPAITAETVVAPGGAPPAHPHDDETAL